MALAAKERMARWRAKKRETREAHEAYKEKERQRNNNRRKEGQFKCVVRCPRENYATLDDDGDTTLSNTEKEIRQ